MRTLIFSDVHGNLPALEILLKKEKCDNYIFLGDAVNYGPWSNECVEKINSLDSINLLGNHEHMFLSGNCNIPGLVTDFFNFCYPLFNKQLIISEWKESFTHNNITFCHTLNNSNIYPDTSVYLTSNYIIGHSHYQSYHENNKFFLYVAGSVGQNRKYINQIDYLIIEENVISLKNIIYNEEILINEMISRKYPKSLIDYYQNKKRI